MAKNVYKVNGKEIGLDTDEEVIIFDISDQIPVPCNNPYFFQQGYNGSGNLGEMYGDVHEACDNMMKIC